MDDLITQGETTARYLDIVKDPDFVFDKMVQDGDKAVICRKWLYAWERHNIDLLRKTSFVSSRWVGEVTLLVHSFQPDEEMFFTTEFSILHTWKLIGSLPVVIVTDCETAQMADFRNRFPKEVSVVISPYLKRGDISSLSRDCLMNLDKYFSTRYCMIIQCDGFPIRDNLDEFIGKWDYIGAPCVRDRPLQYVADMLLMDCLNGGFCLRSHSLCEATTKAWRTWGRYAYDFLGWTMIEDWFYSVFSRYNPFHRFRFRFPWATQARRFSVVDLMGAVDVRNLKFVPFGLHGPTTVYLYRDYLAKTGYEPFPVEKCL